MKKVRLLSACCYNTETNSGQRHWEGNRRLILDCLDRAAAFRPDVVVFPEICLHQGIGNTPEAIWLAETVPGPTTERVAEKARELNSHVLLPLYEKSGKLVYNSAALINRQGRIVGAYRKFQTTGYEMEDGVQPGKKVPVWDTDCGRMGCAICFDIKFPEVGLQLSRQKAQLVLWPTMFAGGRRVASWAVEYGFIMVRSWTAGGWIVDSAGATLAKEGPVVATRKPAGRVRWTFAEVNTDRKTYHLDFNLGKLPALVAKYGGGVTVRQCQPEGVFILISNRDDVTVEEMESEFGLEDLRDYLDGARRLKREKLSGKMSTRRL